MTSPINTYSKQILEILQKFRYPNSRLSKRKESQFNDLAIDQFHLIDKNKTCISIVIAREKLDEMCYLCKIEANAEYNHLALND